MSKGKSTGIAGITKTDDGFYILITATINGKRVYREKRISGGDLSEAAAEQGRMRVALAKEVEIKAISGTGKDTFKAFAESWIDYLKSTETKPTTIVSYREKLKSHISVYWDEWQIKDIQPRAVSDWLKWMSETQGHYATKSLHGGWRVFCACIRWISVQCNLPSPVENVRFKARGKDERKKETLTGEELARVIANIDCVKDPYRSAILLAATTGARIGEVTALRWQDLDLDRGLMLIHRSNSKGHVMESTKTRNNRAVPLDASVCARLMDLKASGVGADDSLIFKSKRGTPLYASNFRIPLLVLGEQAKLGKKLGCHVFRRGMNDLLRTTATEVVARSILGHKSPSMTQHYSTVGHDEARKALGSVLGPPPAQSGIVVDDGGGSR